MTHPAQRRCALLVNPSAGKGRTAELVGAVQARLEAGELQVTRMQGRDGAEAGDIARSAVADGYDVLAVMGGDGIVHLAIQALAGSSTALGVIPTGTGNDVARYLQLPTGRPLEAAEVICRQRTRTMDLGDAGGTYYATVLATGCDSLVNERANELTWPRGRMRYHLATLMEFGKFRPNHYTLDLDGERVHRDAMLVAVGNGPTYGGGLPITNGALLDDGLLDVVVIRSLSKPQLVAIYPRLVRGTHVRHPAYEHHRVRRVSVAAPGMVAYADGERIGPLPLDVTCAEAALTVCVPSR